MKTKNIKSAVLSVALISAILFTVNNASADEVGSETTTAQIIFNPGDLTLESAPSIDFGTQAIPTSTQVYSDASFTNDLSVSDLRGSDAGWKVSAKLGIFQNGGSATLAGSSIALNSASVAAEDGTLSTGPVPSSTIDLPSDSTEVSIEDAVAGTGSGLWHTTWSQANLTVYPGTVKSGMSTSNIDWILSDTP